MKLSKILLSDNLSYFSIVIFVLIVSMVYTSTSHYLHVFVLLCFEMNACGNDNSCPGYPTMSRQKKVLCWSPCQLLCMPVVLEVSSWEVKF